MSNSNTNEERIFMHSHKRFHAKNSIYNTNRMKTENIQRKT